VRWKAMLCALGVVLAGLVAVSPATAPAAQAGTIWDAGDIISDAEFYDSKAMTASEIQAFLNAQIGTCSNAQCLNVITITTPSYPAASSSSTGNLICKAVTGGSMSAAQWIYRVQVACSISAKVILVTLQKEQSLVTSRSPSAGALRAAMGMACPDTAPCDSAFAGLATQIYYGARQLMTYKAASFARQPGPQYVQYSPNAACGGTTVNVANYATAALYSYTPYQPNAAALSNLYGLGDECSAYGNRNFWRMYRDWFGFKDGPAPGAPSAPQGLYVEKNYGGSLTLSWSSPSDPGTSSVTDYQISYTSIYHPTPVVVDDGVSTATTHTFVNPTPGLTFTFQVRAVNGSGPGYAATIVATPPAAGAPSPPGSLRVSVNDGSVLTLEWSAPVDKGSSAVTDYVISYTSKYHPNPAIVDDGVSTKRTHTFVSPTPGLEFTFSVQAKNASGLGAPTSIVATPISPGQPTEDLAKPGAPTGLRVTVNDGATLTLAWSPPVSTGTSAITDYVISYTSQYHPTPVVVNDGVSKSTTYTFVTPTPGLKFTFRVQAVNSSGTGPAATIDGTPPIPSSSPAPKAPGAPSGLQVSVNDGSALTLVWSAPSSSGSSAVTDYVISYTSRYHPNPVIVDDGVSTATTHTFVNPTPGLEFTFRVQAKNAAGTGKAATVVATPPVVSSGSAPGAPSGLQVSVNDGSALTLVWSAPSSSGSSAVTDYVISYTSRYHPNPVIVDDGVSTATTHTFVNPTPGLEFTFRVQAKNDTGVGPAATILATPPTAG